MSERPSRVTGKQGESEPWARAARRRRRHERKEQRRSPSGPLRSSKSGER